jgi:nitrogen-specific signal transduction histidine kinase
MRVPIRDSSGAVTHLATIERDVTEQKSLEARLRQSDKMQALGTLAGGIAHDFNNLLTAILGSLELVGPKIADQPRVQRLVGNAVQAAQRGASLTRRLLSFSRSRDLRPRAVDVNGLIEGMSDLLSGSLGGLVTIETRLTPEAPAASVDADQLELAILNLCINARDAMPEGGRIVLSTRVLTIGDDPDLTPGDYMSVEIVDSGSGIAPEILARVCEPFFTTKSVGQGTGLGLAMVFGLAQQSAGRLRIESAPGAGTRVEIVLPRANAASPAEIDAAPAALPAARSARILVVDDDAEVRHVTASFLSSFGYHESEAADGSTALSLMEQNSFDLVVADLAMPGMTGVELAQSIRARWAEIPVLIVTGHAEAIPIPPDLPVLRKPFESADLAAEVSRLLDVAA